MSDRQAPTPGPTREEQEKVLQALRETAESTGWEWVTVEDILYYGNGGLGFDGRWADKVASLTRTLTVCRRQGRVMSHRGPATGSRSTLTRWRLVE